MGAALTWVAQWIWSPAHPVQRRVRHREAQVGQHHAEQPFARIRGNNGLAPLRPAFYDGRSG
jgi:hypothetical protein